MDQPQRDEAHGRAARQANDEKPRKRPSERRPNDRAQQPLGSRSARSRTRMERKRQHRAHNTHRTRGKERCLRANPIEEPETRRRSKDRRDSGEQTRHAEHRAAARRRRELRRERPDRNGRNAKADAAHRGGRKHQRETPRRDRIERARKTQQRKRRHEHPSRANAIHHPRHLQLCRDRGEIEAPCYETGRTRPTTLARNHRQHRHKPGRVREKQKHARKHEHEVTRPEPLAFHTVSLTHRGRTVGFRPSQGL